MLQKHMHHHHALSLHAMMLLWICLHNAVRQACTVWQSVPRVNAKSKNVIWKWVLLILSTAEQLKSVSLQVLIMSSSLVDKTLTLGFAGKMTLQSYDVRWWPKVRAHWDQPGNQTTETSLMIVTEVASSYLGERRAKLIERMRSTLMHWYYCWCRTLESWGRLSIEAARTS